MLKIILGIVGITLVGVFIYLGVSSLVDAMQERWWPSVTEASLMPVVGAGSVLALGFLRIAAPNASGLDLFWSIGFLSGLQRVLLLVAIPAVVLAAHGAVGIANERSWDSFAQIVLVIVLLGIVTVLYRVVERERVRAYKR